MPGLPRHLHPREAPYQFGAKDSGGWVSGKAEQQKPRSLLSAQRESEDFLPEWRAADLPRVPDVDQAPGSRVPACGGGGQREKGSIKIERGKLRGDLLYTWGCKWYTEFN